MRVVFAAHELYPLEGARRSLTRWVRALFIVALLAPCSERAYGQGDEAFHVPVSLKGAVEFWKRIYTEIDTGSGLLHDTEDLARVYAVVSLPAVRANHDAYARAQRERIQEALAALAAGERTGSKEERRLLALFPPSVSREALAAASQRVRFQRGQADRFRAGLERKGRWEAHILAVLRERGLPTELAALPHVESSFDPSARSSAGASGIWQFTRPTGRLFLRIDDAIDERNDPHRATIAAAQLLQENYRMTGTWPLAITAYNHGANGMLRAVRQLGTQDIGEIVARYKSPAFGFASRNFYAEFLAALDVDRDPTRYFGSIVAAEPDRPVTVELGRTYSARAVASAFGVPLAALRDVNPALLESVWSGRRPIPAGYRLRVPGDRAPAAIAGVLASIPSSTAAHSAETTPTGQYRVRPGDSLGRIARRFGASEQELAELNGIANPDVLVVGTILRVRSSEPQGSPAMATPVGTYEVRRGDTLHAIARTLGIGVEALIAVNDLSDHHRIFPGQRLSIPVPGAGTAR